MVRPLAAVVHVLLLLSAVLSVSSGLRVAERYAIRPVRDPNASAVPGSAKIAVNDTVFRTIVPVLLEKFKTVGGSIVIPAQQAGQLDIDEVCVQNLTIGGMTVKLDRSGKINIRTWNVTAIVPQANFTYHYWLIDWRSCAGAAHAEIHSGRMALSLNLTIGSDGLLNVTAGDVEVDLGNLDTTVSMTDCPSMDVVAQLIIAVFKNNIKSQLEEVIPEKINSVVQNKTQEVLSNLPVAFMDAPNITEGRMELSLAILPNVSSNRSVAPDDVLPLKQPFPPGELAVVSSFDAVNNGLRALNNWSLLNVTVPIPDVYNSSLIKPIYPELYELCRECAFRIGYGVAAAPWFEDRGDGGFLSNAPNGTFVVSLLAKNGTTVVALRVATNTTADVHRFAISNNTVVLKLRSVSIPLNVELSRIGNLNSTAINIDIKWLLDTLIVPVINAEPHGYTLPFDAAGLFFDLSTGAMSLGMDSALIDLLINHFVGGRWRSVAERHNEAFLRGLGRDAARHSSTLMRLATSRAR